MDTFIVRTQIRTSLIVKTGRKLEIKCVTLRQGIRKTGNII